MKNIKCIIKYIFLSMIIIVITYGITCKFLLKIDYPFVYKPALILSGSMEPTISVDDLVFVKEAKDLKVGDIITFYDENGNKVIHRIVNIDENNITTKGDANNIEDKPITSDKVFGIYSFKIPYLGKVIKFLKTPLGLFILILLVTIIIYLPSNLIKIKNEKVRKAANLSCYLIIISVFSIAGYYSKYVSSIAGSDTGTVAKFSYDEKINLTLDFNDLTSGNNILYFDVNNNKSSISSEVDLNYNITLNTTGNLPLTYKIKCISDLDDGYGISTDYLTLINNVATTDGLFVSGSEQTHRYELLVEWDTDNIDYEYSYEVDMIDIEINFTQKD